MGQYISSLCDCCRSREESDGSEVNERTRLLTSSSGASDYYSQGDGLSSHGRGGEEGLGHSFHSHGGGDGGLPDQRRGGGRNGGLTGGGGGGSGGALGDRPTEEANAEQSALSKILHDAAHELIDVSGAPHQSTAVSSSLENHEFAERAQDYSSKLILAAPTLALKFNGEASSPGKWTDGLALVNSSAEQEALLHRDGSLSYEDIDLLNTLSDKITESLHNMRKLPESLVVPFGNPEE